MSIAALPEKYVDTTYVPPIGASVQVRAVDSLQTALENVKPGDELVLEAGAQFGSIVLPVKQEGPPINVRTSSTAITSGQRITPNDAPAMPKIVGPSPSMPALSCMPRAHGFRFIGVDFISTGGANQGLVRFGTGSDAAEDFPHHLTLDRCLVRGDKIDGGKRGVLFSGNYLAVIDSYLPDWKIVGQDAQAICGWTGYGPFKIVNNYLEASGENVMFGGADPSVADLVPADIEVSKNLFSKPLSWNPNAPEYDGSAWSIKNLFELKNARRVLISENVFERTWTAAQAGCAVLFTTKNDSGNCPWTTVEDVNFVKNIVRGAAKGISISLTDHVNGSKTGARVHIAQTLFEDIGSQPLWGSPGGGILFSCVGASDDVHIVHNTALNTGTHLISFDAYFKRFVLDNNIFRAGEYGIKGSGTGAGVPTLNGYCPEGYSMKRNVMIGGYEPSYPVGNFFPATDADVGFIDGGYLLKAESPYHNAATDGTDIGYGGLSTNPEPTPTPIPEPTPTPTPEPTPKPKRGKGWGRK